MISVHIYWLNKSLSEHLHGWKLPLEWNKQDSCPYCTIQSLRKCRRKLKTDKAVGVMQIGKILFMILKSINILSSKPQPFGKCCKTTVARMLVFTWSAKRSLSFLSSFSLFLFLCMYCKQPLINSLAICQWEAYGKERQILCQYSGRTTPSQLKFVGSPKVQYSIWL